MNKFLKRLAGKGIQIASVGVIDGEDIFGDEDLEIEEAQLLQLITIRKQNEKIIDLLDNIYSELL